MEFRGTIPLLYRIKDSQLCVCAQGFVPKVNILSGKICLFNIKEDPCEIEDLTTAYPDIVEKMMSRLNKEISKKISRIVPFFRDPRSAPKLLNYTWNVWADNLK